MLENDLRSMPPPPAQTPMRTPTPHQLPTRSVGANLPSSSYSNSHSNRGTYSYFDRTGTIGTQTPVRHSSDDPSSTAGAGTGTRMKNNPKSGTNNAEPSPSSNCGPCPSITKAPQLDVPTAFGTPRYSSDQRKTKQLSSDPTAEAAPDSNTSTHYSTTSSNMSSPPGTPFRFTGFPASLPRVHPRQSQSRDELQLDYGEVTNTDTNANENANANANADTHAAAVHAAGGTSTPSVHRRHKGPFQSPYRKNSASKNRPIPVPPGTVRKRMTFADGEYGNGEDEICDPPEHDCSDYRDDSQSQNTSLSSLSVDGTSSNYFGKTPARMILNSMQATPFGEGRRAHAHAAAHGNISGATSRAVWLSPILSDEKQKAVHLNASASLEEMGMDVNSTGGGSGTANHPTNAKEDLWARSTATDPPLRTRLNFNSMFSPDTGSGDVGDRKRHSVSDEFQDLKDDATPARKMVDRKNSLPRRQFNHYYLQKFQAGRTNSFPPASSGLSDNPIHSESTAFAPFQIGVSDESQAYRLSPTEANFRLRLDSTQCSPIKSVPEYDALPSRVTGTCDMDVERTQSPPEPKKFPGGNTTTSAQSPVYSAEMSTQSGHSGGQCSSSSATSKSRKLRPMPDMSAFEVGSTATISTIHNDKSVLEQESDSAASNPNHNRAQPLCPPTPLRTQPLCPPTPLRTPAWAHKSALNRQNSLVSTKILAACPPQVIDGFSSLEDSLMEDEKPSKSFNHAINSSFGGSFTAVLEENENEDMHPTNASTVQNDMDVANGYKNIQRHSGDHSSSSKSLFRPLYSSLEIPEEQNRENRRRNSSGNIKSMLDSGSGHESMEETFSGTNGHTLWKQPKQPRLSTCFHQVGSIVFDSDFDNISSLGSGAFADVFRARLKADQQYYAVKRNRRQFRGRRDRERALDEIRIMQRLQTVTLSEWREGLETSKSSYILYLLFFIRAWQEDGYLFSQTELCCRDTCSHLMLNLTTNWNAASKKYPSLLRNLANADESIRGGITDAQERLVPENTIWKICHDVACGLSHIHSHNIVHHDIKPLNIFFVHHAKLGALCKIGDFGMAGEIGTSEDGQEGDTAYMPSELLTSAVMDPSGDIFSLGITLYELATAGSWMLPREGVRWHEIRKLSHVPELPQCRSSVMVNLIKKMILPNKHQRPTADEIMIDNPFMKAAPTQEDKFLSEYVHDVDEHDRAKEQELMKAQLATNIRQTPTPMQGRHISNASADRSWNVRTPTPGMPGFPA